MMMNEDILRQYFPMCYLSDEFFSVVHSFLSLNTTEFLESSSSTSALAVSGIISIILIVIIWLLLRTIVAVWKLIFGSRQHVRSLAARMDVPVPQPASTSINTATVVKKNLIQYDDAPNIIRCYNPANMEFLGDIPAMSRQEVNAAVLKARQTQTSWAKTTFDQRRELMHVLLEYILAHQEDICAISTLDSGKTAVDGAFGEILTTCEKIRWLVAHGESALRTEYRSVGLVASHKVARVDYVPVGVMGCCVPWNYPFHNMYGQITAALFAGNSCVVKVSEYAAWSADYYLRIIRAALRVCGHDPAIVQVVQGFGDTGEALVKSGVDKLVFIGSPTVGKIVMKQAAENLTPVVLELGGKDAAIVCEDCDFSQVIQLAMRGTFQNCGQNCIGLERLVVHTDIYDRLINSLEKEVHALQQGNPKLKDVDCGAMVTPHSLQHIQELVDEAIEKGARLLVGGHRHADLVGQYYSPTLLVDVTSDMRIANEEVFGPVMTVLKAINDEHALTILNSTKYGLNGSVFSLNYARAEHIAVRMRSGMCNINDFGVNYLCQSLPFGGVNHSGFDRFGGIEGLRGCCLTRSVTTDKYPFIRTTIPSPVQYPMSSSSFEFCKRLITFLYTDGLLSRLVAILQLVRVSGSKKKIA